MNHPIILKSKKWKNITSALEPKSERRENEVSTGGYLFLSGWLCCPFLCQRHAQTTMVRTLIQVLMYQSYTVTNIFDATAPPVV